MKYTKNDPEISYLNFYELATQVTHFNSITGQRYEVKSVQNDSMTFTRKSRNTTWSMDLKGVHKAYIELNDFRTANFASFVPRTHSPALGLLLHLRLLIKQ